MGLAELAAKVNWIDILILIFFIKISYTGFKRGFSSEVIPLLSIFAALMFSLHNYEFLSQFIAAALPFLSRISHLISFLFITLAMLLACRVANAFMTRMVRLQVVSLIDRLGGMFLGIARACLMSCFILIILSFMPFHYIENSIKDRSLFGVTVLRIGPAIYDKIVTIPEGSERRSKRSMKRKILKKHLETEHKKRGREEKREDFIDRLRSGD